MAVGTVGAQVLAFNQTFTGSSISSLGSVQGMGGRMIIVVNASAYAGAGGLFLQGQGPSGAWINVNSSGFTADQTLAFDGLGGQYRLVNNASSSIGVYAVLGNIRY